MTRLGLRTHLGILWRLGSTNARLFLLLLLVYLVVAFGVSVWLFQATWNGRLPFEVFVSFALAVSTGPAFASPLLGPMYCASVLRELLARGWSPAKKPFYEEMARYLESCNDNGDVPGGLSWGLAAWGVYYGMSAFAILFSIAYFPSLGPWTPFVFAAVGFVVTAGFSLWHMIQVGKEFSEAEKTGFRLLELREATRDGSS